MSVTPEDAPLRPGYMRAANGSYYRIGGIGSQGPPGAPGPPGADGTDGVDGAPGATGAQGPAGVDGAPGTAGATGPEGPKGDQGDPGAAGPPGADGAPGSTGATGPEGPKGDQGDTGAQGIQGVAGPPGADGAPGPAGADSTVPGPEGPAGPPGADGAQGPPGADGAPGTAGATGPEGPKGDTGDTGGQGIQGVQGPIGPEGPAGADGADYDPAAADLRYVGQSGDQVMQGPLTIAISLGAQDVTGQRVWAYTQPTDPAHLTRKDYVDNAIAASGGGGTGGLDEATADLRYVNTAGDAMTGPLSIDGGLNLSGLTGTSRSMTFQTAFTTRWAMGKNATAEGGLNTGSDFSIGRYDDTGAWLADALMIQRNTGNVYVGAALEAADLGANTIAAYMSMTVAGKPVLVAYGTQTITGGANLTLDSDGTAAIILDRAAPTNYAHFEFRTAGLQKWTVGTRGNPANEDFYFFNKLTTKFPIKILVASDEVILEKDPTQPLGVATKQYVDARTPKITPGLTPPLNPAVNDIWVNTN